MNEPLNLTEDNKRELRALVNALTQDLPQRTTQPVTDYFDWAEAHAVMRRAFIPTLATQIYNAKVNAVWVGYDPAHKGP